MLLYSLPDDRRVESQREGSSAILVTLRMQWSSNVGRET